MIVTRIRATRGYVAVDEMEAGEKVVRGVICPDDTFFREWNIKPRWCRVVDCGKDVHGLEPGQWILVEHGRWTYRLDVGGRKIQFVDPKAILVVADERPPVDLVATRPSGEATA